MTNNPARCNECGKKLKHSLEEFVAFTREKGEMCECSREY
jgi:DNA-directed RNA polymerase subunit N (RpoN/RPB10)